MRLVTVRHGRVAYPWSGANRPCRRTGRPETDVRNL